MTISCSALESHSLFGLDFLVVDFGGGCSSSCCSCCDRGKTKSTPCPFDLDWNGLGLEFDNKLVIRPYKSFYKI